MSDRFKYFKNGVYRCENFTRYVERNNFPRVPIGSLGGRDGWYISFQVQNENNPPTVFPLIHCYNNFPTSMQSYFFNVIKKDGSSAFKTYGRRKIWLFLRCNGLDMNIGELLENGYLDDDGALTIEYGIHVDAIIGAFGIWKFNFEDRFFNSKQDLTILHGDPRNEKILYGHRQLLGFHSPIFQNQETRFRLEYTLLPALEKWRVEEFLQVAHGVRIQFFKDRWISMIAHCNQLRNVVHYVDLQMIQISREDLSDHLLFENCIEFGLRHFFAHLVNLFKSLEDLKKIIQQLNMEKMSGEAMKTFAAKIFELTD